MGCARPTVPAWLLLAAGVAVATSPLAETYKWVDDQGRVQYTDRLPPESRGMTELNKQGMTRKVTEPPLTAAQRRALEEGAEQKRQADRALVLQRNQESALLSSYTSEDDIDLAMRRNLALIGAGIISAEARIKALQRRQLSLERERLFYENKPFPDTLTRELASVIAEIPKQYAVIEQKNREALEVTERYAAQKLQFREAKARMAREAIAVKRQ